jgi:hypothetical protein
MNSKQRPAIFIATVLIALLVLFHAPWSGYETTYMRKSYPTAEAVKAGEKDGLGFVPIHIYTPTPLSASEWKTNEPVVNWFGSPWNILGSALLIVCVTGVWCYLYRTIPTNGE